MVVAVKSGHTTLEMIQKNEQIKMTHILDGSAASSTLWTELNVIVILTVSTTVPFEEVSVPELTATLAADIMLRMPHFAHSDNDLAHNWLSTMSTVSFGNGRDSVTTTDISIVESSDHRVSMGQISAGGSTSSLKQF